LELLDIKIKLILKTKFDAFFSDSGTYDVINFWQFLPCENFQKLRKSLKVICMSFWNDVHMPISILSMKLI